MTCAAVHLQPGTARHAELLGGRSWAESFCGFLFWNPRAQRQAPPQSTQSSAPGCPEQTGRQGPGNRAGPEQTAQDPGAPPLTTKTIPLAPEGSLGKAPGDRQAGPAIGIAAEIGAVLLTVVLALQFQWQRTGCRGRSGGVREKPRGPLKPEVRAMEGWRPPASAWPGRVSASVARIFRPAIGQTQVVPGPGEWITELLLRHPWRRNEPGDRRQRAPRNSSEVERAPSPDRRSACCCAGQTGHRSLRLPGSGRVDRPPSGGGRVAQRRGCGRGICSHEPGPASRPTPARPGRGHRWPPARG